MNSSSAESSSPAKRTKLDHGSVEPSDETCGMYEDLMEFGQSKDFGRLNARMEDAEKRNAELSAELVDIKAQLDTVLMEKQRLEDNITLVYNTALRELTRKDKEINELRSLR